MVRFMKSSKFGLGLREQAIDKNLAIRVIEVEFFILSKQEDDFSHAKRTVRVSASFTSLLLATRTSTVPPASKNVLNDHFHQ